MQTQQGYYDLTCKVAGTGQENPLSQKRKSSNHDAGLSQKHMPQDLFPTPPSSVLNTCSMFVPNQGEREILLPLAVSSSPDLLGKSDHK